MSLNFFSVLKGPQGKMSAGKALTDDMLLKLRALMYFPCCSVLLF